MPHNPYRKKWLVMQHRSGLLKTFKNGTRWWAFLFHGVYFLVKGVVGLGLLLLLAEFLLFKAQDLVFLIADKQSSDGIAVLLYLVGMGLGIGWWVVMYKLAKKAPAILLPKETLKGWQVIAEFDTKQEAKAYIQRVQYQPADSRA